MKTDRNQNDDKPRRRIGLGPLHDKAVRAVRKRRWAWALSSGAPLRWHCGRPNFGDDINPSFFQRVSGSGVRLARPDEPHLLGVGSICEQATRLSTLAGSGLIRPMAAGASLDVAGAVAVRGELTAACLPSHLRRKDALPLGDPLCLIGLLQERSSSPRFDIGIIPHVCALNEFRVAAPEGRRLIDVRKGPWAVVREIANCRMVMSQSLHGLIVADSLGIPNVWIAPDSRMIGGDFKFRDYYSTTERPKQPTHWRPAGSSRTASTDAFVSRYRHDAAAYLATLREAVRAFASERSTHRMAA
ncbi:polysaccharide pyruvyl transferase family protein [Botrimarina sp.]|uniref:polysaccharide pyruvyl transferase family protein n=1 Tax=Botrimarina sp. TaxID=2795802 RepID=UPI0032EBE63A